MSLEKSGMIHVLPGADRSVSVVGLTEDGTEAARLLVFTPGLLSTLQHFKLLSVEEEAPSC